MSKEYKLTESIRDFILGGNAYFTITNTDTNKGCKYHIKKRGPVYFVSVKKNNRWVYGGYLKTNYKDYDYYYSIGKEGHFNTNTEEIKGLKWVLQHADNMDPRISITHHKRCACCGRLLHDEQSILRGIGPKCYKKILP